jgi:hypothetical protein
MREKTYFIDIRPKTEIRQRFTGKAWTWVGYVDGVEVCEGSYTAVQDSLREATTKPRLTQSAIDGSGEHRRGFTFHLSQIRTSVMGSLRKAW